MYLLLLVLFMAFFLNEIDVGNLTFFSSLWFLHIYRLPRAVFSLKLINPFLSKMKLVLIWILLGVVFVDSGYFFGHYRFCS